MRSFDIDQCCISILLNCVMILALGALSSQSGDTGRSIMFWMWTTSCCRREITESRSSFKESTMLHSCVSAVAQNRQTKYWHHWMPQNPAHRNFKQQMVNGS